MGVGCGGGGDAGDGGYWRKGVGEGRRWWWWLGGAGVFIGCVKTDSREKTKESRELYTNIRRMLLSLCQ